MLERAFIRPMNGATEKRALSQEALKLIACVSMLIDHIGAALFPQATVLRIIGRLAFPIYSFLLAEGVCHTRHPRRYALRLTAGMLLAEYPFDALFFGGWTWRHQSVMVTLLLAFFMGRCVLRVKPLWGKLLIVLPFAAAAEWLHTDYGWYGVAVVALFLLTRQAPYRALIQIPGLFVLSVMLSGLQGIQVLCTAAMIPILFYSGKKAENSPWVQAAFYLFYPVHLALLLLIARLL